VLNVLNSCAILTQESEPDHPPADDAGLAEEFESDFLWFPADFATHGQTAEQPVTFVPNLESCQQAVVRLLVWTLLLMLAVAIGVAMGRAGSH
jgi:hypothetical protein